MPSSNEAHLYSEESDWHSGKVLRNLPKNLGGMTLLDLGKVRKIPRVQATQLKNLLRSRSAKKGTGHKPPIKLSIDLSNRQKTSYKEVSLVSAQLMKHTYTLRSSFVT